MTLGKRFLHTIPSKSLSFCLAGLLSVSGIASAQDSSQQPHPWRRAGDLPPSEQAQRAPPDQDGPDQGPPPPPNYSANQAPPPYQQQPQQYPGPQPPRD